MVKTISQIKCVSELKNILITYEKEDLTEERKRKIRQFANNLWSLPDAGLDFKDWENCITAVGSCVGDMFLFSYDRDGFKDEEYEKIDLVEFLEEVVPAEEGIVITFNCSCSCSCCKCDCDEEEEEEEEELCMSFRDGISPSEGFKRWCEALLLNDEEEDDEDDEEEEITSFWSKYDQWLAEGRYNDHSWLLCPKKIEFPENVLDGFLKECLEEEDTVFLDYTDIPVMTTKVKDKINKGEMSLYTMKDSSKYFLMLDDAFIFLVDELGNQCGTTEINFFNFKKEEAVFFKNRHLVDEEEC